MVAIDLIVQHVHSQLEEVREITLTDLHAYCHTHTHTHIHRECGITSPSVKPPGVVLFVSD